MPSYEVYPLLPYQYEIIFALWKENLAASELACDGRLRHLCVGAENPSLGMVNRLRPLIRRGWIEKLPHDPASGIYRLTEAARAVLTGGPLAAP